MRPFQILKESKNGDKHFYQMGSWQIFFVHLNLIVEHNVGVQLWILLLPLPIFFPYFERENSVAASLCSFLLLDQFAEAKYLQKLSFFISKIQKRYQYECKYVISV